MRDGEQKAVFLVYSKLVCFVGIISYMMKGVVDISNFFVQYSVFIFQVCISPYIGKLDTFTSIHVYWLRCQQERMYLFLSYTFKLSLFRNNNMYTYWHRDKKLLKISFIIYILVFLEMKTELLSILCFAFCILDTALSCFLNDEQSCNYLDLCMTYYLHFPSV